MDVGETNQTSGDWLKTQTDTFTVIDIPRMLYLPTYIFGEIFHKQYWMPADLLEVIVEAEAEYDIQIEQELWQMMKNWCIAAMQLATPFGTSSHVATTVGAITQADDSFLAWCKFRIDTTLGKRRDVTHPKLAGHHQDTRLPIPSAIQPTLPIPPAIQPIPPGHPRLFPLPPHLPPPQAHAFALPPQNATAGREQWAQTQHAAPPPTIIVHWQDLLI